ncbi:hypothetical protein M0811_09931 [Anaeramoeba ignava]|uniref:Uncharacterized protein n=1 Tax=Anaeramoeba ignava TaxID=1746090 RepID=A0A9Q0R9E0_ANAIG|nr:hypothetical protein M0811_09931 [Anaeramoeba ignava]
MLKINKEFDIIDQSNKIFNLTYNYKSGAYNYFEDDLDHKISLEIFYDLLKQSKKMGNQITEETSLEDIMKYIIMLHDKHLMILPRLYSVNQTAGNKVSRDISKSVFDLEEDDYMNFLSEIIKNIFNEDNKESLLYVSLALLRPISKIKKEYLDNDYFVKVFVSYIWYNIKWFGNHTLNMCDFVDKITKYINSITRPKYFIKSCLNDKGYVCGRVVERLHDKCEIRKKQGSRIIIFDTVSSYDNSIRNESMEEVCKSKDLK